MKYPEIPYMKFVALITVFYTMAFVGSCQQNDLKMEQAELPPDEIDQIYVNSRFHEVIDLSDMEPWDKDKKVKNVILMIGDGMGPSQVYSGVVANKGKLNILNFTHTGFAKTASSDSDVTDSAASGTAMACGVKTYNGAIGVDSLGNSVETILEMAENKGLSTGLVATCRITHATPASFIAHQASRQMYEAIAEDFTKTDIDVFIGGGRNNFTKRQDGKDLLDSLKQKGYQVITDTDSLSFIEEGKIAGLIHEDDQERFSGGRGNMLEEATKASLNVLSQNTNGFFLMIEGSQIDWGGHANNTSYIVEEMLDFDRTVGIVLDFAVKNPGTLVIITADHETGGFSIIDSDISTGTVEGAFSTEGHTGVMVPVYAIGPGSDLFSGIYENTEIFNKMKQVFGF